MTLLDARKDSFPLTNDEGDVIVADVDASTDYVLSEEEREDAAVAELEANQDRLNEDFDAARVARDMVEIENNYRPANYPATVEAVVRDRVKAARLQETREEVSNFYKEANNAYSELGGTTTKELIQQPLENVINEKYEPWQTDIKLAVEKFGLVEYSLEDFKRMKEKDRKLFQLEFYRYLENISANTRLIDASGGKADIDMNLKDRFAKQSEAELNQYRLTLDVLIDDLEATGIPQWVREEFGVHKKSDSYWSERSKRLTEARINSQKHPAKDAQVIATSAGPAFEWVNKQK